MIRIAYYEIYFNNVPKNIDGGYCCIKVTMAPKKLTEYRGPGPEPCWNDHHFRCGRKAYTAIRAWAKFLGLSANQYNDGSISTYTYNMDYSHFPTLLAIAKKEIGETSVLHK